MTDSPFTDWFQRTLGEWRSERRYIYFFEGKEPTNQLITTYFGVDNPQGDLYTIDWESHVHKDGKILDAAMKGHMDLRLVGDELHRDRGYFTDNETHQRLNRIDEDTVVFTTAYDGQSFREEIRFIGDTIRLRQTVGFSEADGRLLLSGQYTETRL